MQSAWLADMARINASIKPYIYRHYEFSYISSDCPKPLSDLYTKLCQIGYANGWMGDAS